MPDTGFLTTLTKWPTRNSNSHIPVVPFKTIQTCNVSWISRGLILQTFQSLIRSNRSSVESPRNQLLPSTTAPPFHGPASSIPHTIRAHRKPGVVSGLALIKTRARVPQATHGARKQLKAVQITNPGTNHGPSFNHCQVDMAAQFTAVVTYKELALQARTPTQEHSVKSSNIPIQKPKMAR